MGKYGEKTEKEISRELYEHKHQGKWKSRKQAIAVGISEARRKGYKAPPKKK